MDKQLHDLTKEELISIVQDYQEMVSEIEHEVNCESGLSQTKLNIRSILDKHLMGTSEQPTECDDCGIKTSDLITKSDHHGGMKTVCRDRDACHVRGG